MSSVSCNKLARSELTQLMTSISALSKRSCHQDEAFAERPETIHLGGDVFGFASLGFALRQSQRKLLVACT